MKLRRVKINRYYFQDDIILSDKFNLIIMKLGGSKNKYGEF